MLPKIQLDKTNAYQSLKQHSRYLSQKSIQEFFTTEPGRAQKYRIKSNNLHLDYSRNQIDPKSLVLFDQLCYECKLTEAKKLMLEGQAINEREYRAVNHVAIRSAENSNGAFSIDEWQMVQESFAKIKTITEQIHKTEWKGFSGLPIQSIVNIGIGGSHLGPEMVVRALKPFQAKGIKVYFVSNVDGNNMLDVLHKVLPENTLFIISSKSFGTQETLTNAKSVKKWFLQKVEGDSNSMKQHFIAVTNNEGGALEFGIPLRNILRIPNSVGGRFSIWSAVGLPISLAVGNRNFEAFLEGARAMDGHFFATEGAENMPTLMACLSLVNTHFGEITSETVLPYSYHLSMFPDYLQQMVMESNGKSVNRDGNAIDYPTAPVIWGGSGTNGQHAYFQMLHQGSQIIASDFILPVKSHGSLGDHQNKLIANCLAQVEALTFGKKDDDLYRNFEGNRPVNLLLMDILNPFNLGQLIALYEHKTFVQGILLNIYSFDQWGVELGKVLADEILPMVRESNIENKLTEGTQALLKMVHQLNKLK